MDVSIVNQLIRQRRSVFPKDYTGEKVDSSIVSQIIYNATWAPTHKLTEPWRFIVFAGEGIGKLATFQSECYKEVTTRNGTFDETKFNGLKTKPFLSSHIIAVGMRRDPAHRVPEIEEIGAVYAAVQNMYLTATAYGVGAYLSTGGITFFEEAKPFFDLGPEDKLLGFFHVGVMKPGDRDSRRQPVEAVCKWVE